MSKLDNFDGFIFDMDGTLIDSNGVWEKIDRDYFFARHIRVTEKELHAAAAMNYEELYDFAKSKGADCTLENMKKELNALAVNAYRHKIFLKAGVRDYLDIIKKSGKKIALATASPKELYQPVLRNNCIYGMFDAFITTEEAGAEKDFPDIYLKAAEMLEVFPEKCVVFEDTLKGMVSARNAGMYTVAVYDKYSADDIITMRSMADRFIMSFEEMPLI